MKCLTIRFLLSFLCFFPGVLSQYSAIVTGSSSGIGLATAKELLRNNIFVIFAVRNPEKMYSLLNSICQELSIPMEQQDLFFKVMTLDLDSLTSVHNFSKDFLALNVHNLTFLVNNAGAMLSGHGLIHDAHQDFPVDKSFCSNHLGHFLLSCLLFPKLISDGTRVVSVSSAIHLSFKASAPIEEANMWDSKKWDAPAAYAGAKISNIWFVKALQHRFDRYYRDLEETSTFSKSEFQSKNKPVARAYVLAPGTVWTPFHMPYYREFMGGILIWFPVLMSLPSWLSFKSPFQGCQTTLHTLFADHAITHSNPELQTAMERLFVQSPSAKPSPGQMHAECRVSALSPVAADQVKAEKMWSYSLKLVHHILSSKTCDHFSYVE